MTQKIDNTNDGDSARSEETTKRTAIDWFDSGEWPKNVTSMSLPFTGGVRFEYKDGSMVDHSKDKMIEG